MSQEGGKSEKGAVIGSVLFIPKPLPSLQGIIFFILKNNRFPVGS